MFTLITLNQRGGINMSTFLCYKRENGQVGIRNHILIIPINALSMETDSGRWIVNKILKHHDVAPIKLYISE